MGKNGSLEMTLFSKEKKKKETLLGILKTMLLKTIGMIKTKVLVSGTTLNWK